VLHLDPNEYYAADQASLTLDELVKWASDRSSTSGAASSSDAAAGAGSSYLSSQKRRFTHATTSILTPDLERDRRRYALSLYPAILPARGTLISTLIASDVSKYVGFRLLDSVGVWEEGRCSSSSENAGAQAQAEAAEPQVGGQVRRVPGNKEDVFKDKSVGLVDKRRLMKFLMWVAGDFEDDELVKGVWCVSVTTLFRAWDTELLRCEAVGADASREGRPIITVIPPNIILLTSEPRHADRICHRARFVSRRAGGAGAASDQEVPSERGEIWIRRIPCGAVRRGRRDCSRVLQVGNGQWAMGNGHCFCSCSWS
jgi:hypothetical protein